MIEANVIIRVYNKKSKLMNDMIIDSYHYVPWRVQTWMNSEGFDYPMTDEQEVEFKLRFL